MNRHSLAVALVMLLAGCDDGLRTPLPLRVESVGEPSAAPEARSCHAPGVCWTCWYGITIAGSSKQQCGLKFSPMCPGTETVLVMSYPKVTRYDDGTSQRYSETEVLETLEPCE